MVFLKRFSARDLIFYLLAILVMVFTFNAVQQMNEPDDPTYNEIRLLFEQEKVKNFSVEDNVLTLTLRGRGRGHLHPLKYHLADFNVFYNDLHELIDSSARLGSSRTMTTPPAGRSSLVVRLCALPGDPAGASAS